MTWFVLVSPGTFCIIASIYVLGAVAWAVWDGMEDTRLFREERQRKWEFKEQTEARWAGLDRDTHVLLKRLAESRWA